MTKKNLIQKLNQLDTFSFENIVNGNVHETSITDFILALIDSKDGQTSLIKYDDKYKETGNNAKNPKVGTSADFLLVVKDKKGIDHKYAFQAKLGKYETAKKIGNMYSEVNHKIGNKGPYQIDAYEQFLSKNTKINGEYLFYNGDYPDANNLSDINKLSKKSFWILGIDNVKLLMGNVPYKQFNLSDILSLKNNDHKPFVDFLKGFSK